MQLMMMGRPRKATVVAGTNLLTPNQSSFETDTSGWGIFGTSTSLARSTSHASDGSASLACTATAATTTIHPRTQTGTGGRPVRPNTVYTAVADVRHTGTARATSLWIRWYNASGSEISSHQGATSNDTGSYVQRTLSLTSPATAAYAAIAVTFEGALLNETHHIDRAGLIVGSSTTWVLGSGT